MSTVRGEGHYERGNTSATLTIHDDPPVVTIETTDATAVENATGETANPAKFTVRRTGGDTAQPVTVDVSYSGTATVGDDYSNPGTNIDVLTATEVTVQPIDDPDAEGVETIVASISDDLAHYLRGTPNWAQAELDDNVSVRSIEVARGAGSNSSYGYSFEVNITVLGEHLDQVQIRQLINSSTSLTDYNGNNLTRTQTLAQYPSSDPNVVDSNGNWETDTNWDWKSLQVKENTKNGEANHLDSQLFQVPGGRIVPLNATTDTQINWLASVSMYFKLETRRVGTTSILKSKDWGYKWNNYNCYWAVADGAPEISCVASHKGRGLFSDIQGITGLDELN